MAKKLAAKKKTTEPAPLSILFIWEEIGDCTRFFLFPEDNQKARRLAKRANGITLNVGRSQSWAHSNRLRINAATEVSVRITDADLFKDDAAWRNVAGTWNEFEVKLTDLEKVNVCTVYVAGILL